MPPDDEHGRRIADRYRLLQQLGRGGMGVVWAARDERLGRDVAVKEVIPPPGIDDEERAALRERTMREARAAARITGGSAVTIYDVVEEDDKPWIVMERLPPLTLEDVIAERGPLPPRDVARIGVALIHALASAHAAGVLHRDVKPSNVMFAPAVDIASDTETETGNEDLSSARAVLGDFGIAHFDGDSTLTSTGMVMGSPAYIAPERAHGHSATPASDLWSLGVTLWTAVEGHPPFQRANALATLGAVITEEPPLAPNAGPLQPVLDGLLRKNPDERIDTDTAHQLLLEATGDLAAPPHPPATEPTVEETAPLETVPVPPVASPGEVEAAPEFQTAPIGEPGRRRRWLLPLLAAAVAAGLVVLALALRPDDAGQEPGPQAQPTATQDTGAVTTTSPTEPATTTEQAPATTPTPTTESTPEDTEDTENTAVPAGFQLYSDETGFEVAVPQGWRPERDGPRVYLRDPDSSAYLLVDQTDEPAADPVQDWAEQERVVSQRLAGYQRIGDIVPIELRGWRGADWEFVHGTNQGTHVLNRNLVTSPDQAYALYWSVPSSQWEQQRPTFDQIFNSFQPDT